MKSESDLTEIQQRRARIIASDGAFEALSYIIETFKKAPLINEEV